MTIERKSHLYGRPNAPSRFWTPKREAIALIIMGCMGFLVSALLADRIFGSHAIQTAPLSAIVGGIFFIFGLLGTLQSKSPFSKKNR